MNLPIDCKTTRFPIKEKYIDTETPALSCWSVFGRRADGTVDVCDANGDEVFTGMEAALAARVVHERNQWVADLLEALNGARPATWGGRHAD
jgi:hypothetical protein